MSREAPERLRGTVTRRIVRKGTASAHEAVVLHTDEGEELILQRISGNPFSDPETNKLVGQRVTIEGYRLNKVFRYTTVSSE
jgi:hypothetical protein